ncbi:MAG: VIT1/CCC1 transporter family protein [Coriobacteriales bacterium]|jgi:VIT1/CCC1 family predicted Fe2+/Mn2+ transporter|nr:VIT1/CCC1 transporter family protein [Coriobacteriales bacterium]
MPVAIDETTRQALLRFQATEATDHLVYRRLARSEKDPANSALLQQIADDELEHERIWHSYTGATVQPQRLKSLWYSLLGLILGYTFVIKLMEKGETQAVAHYEEYRGRIPEIEEIIAHEQSHEDRLITLLDEERLHYVGAIVLGLSDALVELTGTIAGLTFALANTRVVALAGIITGIAATLSMGASNYLAERENGNPNAFKAALYTGIAYLITVVILVLPYLLLDESLYIEAFVIMLTAVIAVIFFFNYYIAVAKSLPFWSRFGQMAAISLSVAAISFIIGLIAKFFLGVDV